MVLVMHLSNNCKISCWFIEMEFYNSFGGAAFVSLDCLPSQQRREAIRALNPRKEHESYVISVALDSQGLIWRLLTVIYQIFQYLLESEDASV